METGQAKQPSGFRPFEGWALEAIAEADKCLAGTLRFAFATSTLRRQAMFTVLASLEWYSPEVIAMRLGAVDLDELPQGTHPLQVISHALITFHRVRDVLYLVYGPIDGLVGALKRLGDEPLPRESYRQLMSLLTEPEHQVRAQVLQQIPSITPDNLTTLMWLEEPFILKELVENLSPDDVARFWTAVRMINHLSPKVTTGDVVASIKSMKPDANLRMWLQNQVRRASEFPVTLNGLDKAFVPITSADVIRAKALQYRNCLKSQFGELALGRKCYVEYQPSSVIIELIALSEGRWACFDKIYGPGNARPNVATRCAILQKLRASGILIYAHHQEISRWNSVARWLGVHDYDEALIEDIFDLTSIEDAA